MKLKIVKIITVCLIILGVMTPDLVTFGLISEQHNFQGVHYVVYEFQRSREGDRNYILNHKTTGLQKDLGRFACAANIASQLPTPAQQKATANFLLMLIFMIFPCGLALGILLYDRYCIYRAAIFKEKVQALEKLWQQSIQH